MSVIPSLGRVEAALQRALERPFLRRAPLDLPLLKASLKRAVADELKPVAPCRFLLAVPAEQSPHLEPNREAWQRQLAQYFLELVQENGWSAVGQPHVEIVVDPELTGNAVMVSVDEDYLAYHGRPLRERRRRGGWRSLLASAVAMMACVYLAVLLVAPDRIPHWIPTPRWPAGQISMPATGRPSISLPVAGWWVGAGQAASRAVGDGIQSVGQSLGAAVPRRFTGDVVASPGLTVRAGSPSRSGWTIDDPHGYLPAGSSVEWWSFQVTRGESIGDEDRWIRVGVAGPEWGDHVGQLLYVWMGGLRAK